LARGGKRGFQVPGERGITLKATRGGGKNAQSPGPRNLPLKRGQLEEGISVGENENYRGRKKQLMDSKTSKRERRVQEEDPKKEGTEGEVSKQKEKKGKKCPRNKKQSGLNGKGCHLAIGLQKRARIYRKKPCTGSKVGDKEKGSSQNRRRGGKVLPRKDRT